MDNSEFVLRLLVVKVEGVLVPPPEQWLPGNENRSSAAPLTGDELFPQWVRQSSLGDVELRQALTELAESETFQLDPDLERIVRYAHDHSPIRVALLSSGPDEWLKTLVEKLGIRDAVDLPYSYDRYAHGNRDILLKFLMNRFIAGRERTLFLGNTPGDERMARSENTRFRSLTAPPDGAKEAELWDWTADELIDYMRKKQPQS